MSMEKCELITDKAAFPFRICHEVLSAYEQNSLLWHWHSEVELIHVREGEMEYRTDKAIYRVGAGNGIFTGPGVLHAARNPERDTDCRYVVFMFDPVMICGVRESPVYRKYVEPLCAPFGPLSAYLDSAALFGSGMLSLLTGMDRLYRSGTDGCELLITEKLCALWFLLYGEFKPFFHKKETGSADADRRLKAAVSFIQSHYNENISLQDIADACQISKSECCHLFRRSLRQTPLSCLLDYRIQSSLPLLKTDELSMAEIAAALGFHGSSYFAETFKKVLHCTPREYRKMHRRT